LQELRYVQAESAADIVRDQLRPRKSQQRDIYSDLTPGKYQIARHAERPYTLDYVNEVFTHFELHGGISDDRALWVSRSLQWHLHGDWSAKGRDTKERGLRNFGMSTEVPQGLAPDEDGREIQTASVHFVDNK
jgi:acetyl-CoA carboxylase carboxyl transferase subunit alpha